MGAACCKPKDDPKTQKSLENRSCTDILCLLFFVIICGGIMGMGIWALMTGDIDGIIYPADYNGKYCGKPGTALEKYPYAHFPQLDKDIADQAVVLTGKAKWWDFVPYALCVKQCPAKFSIVDTTTYGGCEYVGAEAGSGAACDPTNTPTFYAAFETKQMLSRCFPVLETAPGKQRTLCAVPKCDSTAAEGEEQACISVDGAPDAGNDKVWEVKADSKVVCDNPIKEVTSLNFQPAAQDADSTAMTKKFAEYVTKAAQFSRACEEAWKEMLVCAVGGTVLMGFAWVIFLWLFAGVIVFLAFFVLVVTLLAITIICYVRAGWAPNLTDYVNSTAVGSSSLGGYEYDDMTTSDNKTAYGVMAIIMTVLLVLVLVMLVMWRKCIARCIAIIRESTKVFKVIPSMMIWPLITIVFLTLTYVWAFVVAAYIFYSDPDTYQANLDMVEKAVQDANISSGGVGGSAQAAQDFLSQDPSTQKWVLFWVHLFGVLWVVEFVKACAWITMSGAVCYWYFFKDDPEKKEAFPLLNSCRRVVRYHLGSAAFGALVIAICQLLRYMLATLNFYTQKLQEDNLLFKMALKCASCCVWCLEKTIEFVSYFGFVYIALEGKNFCWSCRETFKFLLTPKNAAQTAVNKVVEKLIVLIIAFTTPTLMALVCYGWLSNNDDYMKCSGNACENNPLYPCVLVWIGSFFLADAIATVFECTIDTIFLCSFKDAAEYDGKYMSKDMREAFGIDAAPPAGISAIQTSADSKQKKDADGGETAASDPTIRA